MKNDDKTKKDSKHRPFPISVRFNEEEFKAISVYAQSRDKKLGTLVRETCLAYLQNFAEHEELFKKINTEDPMKAEQTIFDVLNKHTDTIDKTLKKVEEEINKKLELLDILQRKQLHQFLLYNRELPAEEYGRLEKAANRRIKVILEDVK